MVSSSLKLTSSNEGTEDNPSSRRNYYEQDDDDGDGDDPNPERGDSCVERAMYHLRRHWKILVLGQVMSIFLASGSAAQATLHLDCGLSAPTFTMATAYLIQSSLQGFILVIRQGKERREQRQFAHDTHQVLLVDQPRYDFFHLQLHRPPWQYALMGFLDCQANAVTNMAFRYTTLTSVTLLDAVAIPSAMILSKVFLSRRYTWLHLTGLLVCMLGIVFNVLQDAETDLGQQPPAVTTTTEEKYPHKLWGDILAATGGALFGLNDVMAEAIVRRQGSISEYLAMVGLFGFLFSLCQSLIFERDNILEFFGRNPDAASACSISKGWFLYVLFVGITVVGYIGGTRFLMLSEAAFFGLSLLTGDLWCVAFSVFAEHIVPGPLFFVALVFVLSGVVLYEMAPHPVLDDSQEGTTRTTAQQLAEIDHEFELQQEGMMNEDDDNDNDDDSDDNDEEYDIELL